MIKKNVEIRTISYKLLVARGDILTPSLKGKILALTLCYLSSPQFQIFISYEFYNGQDCNICIVPYCHNFHSSFTQSFLWMDSVLITSLLAVVLPFLRFLKNFVNHSSLAAFHRQIEVLKGTLFPEFLTASEWLILALICERQFG